MALAAALLSPAGPGGAYADSGTVAVVASLDVPVNDLSLVELRRLCLFERRFWKPGHPATVLYPPMGSPARAALLRRLCRTNERGLRHMLLEKMYRGELDLAPKVTRTDKEAVAFVASGRGVLALVSAAFASGASVKVLRVDGRRPGEPGYPLSE